MRERARLRQYAIDADRDDAVVRSEYRRAERPAGLRLDVVARQADGEFDLGLVARIRARGVDRVVHPGRQGEVDLGVQHHWASNIIDWSWHSPCTHSQLSTGLKPQTDAMPLRAHCACTACGSTAALTLTQRG